jgi:hypothetical protein
LVAAEAGADLDGLCMGGVSHGAWSEDVRLVADRTAIRLGSCQSRRASASPST